MAGVAAAIMLASVIIFTRPARSEQMVYFKRIAGTMTLAAAVILTLYAWGLDRVGG